MKPEEKARVEIDKKLIQAGWVVQNLNEFNPMASLGVAVREVQTNSGPVDYLLVVDKKPVGVIEAKKRDEGHNLVAVAEQSRRYIKSGLRNIKVQPHIRFAYEATDILIRFCDYDDEKSRSRNVFYFHKPETLLAWMKDSNTLRNRLKQLPAFDSKQFRECQTKAITNLEKSFSENKPRALIQMATGAGKTYAAVTIVYRLLKFAKAKRILFLVDTKNLGEQAEEEFRKYKPNDDARLFSELYNIKRLNSSYIPEDTNICISTIQRMYSILRDENLDESLEENFQDNVEVNYRPKEVKYNKKYPIEEFDFIIIDECHRSIYNLWQQVLDYFDAFLIGLTATPDNRTFGFFNENIVSEYSHEQAVIDDVNVGRQGTYIIDTEISKKGGCILKQSIETRERLSRNKRWRQLDEDLNYVPSQLDNDIVNLSQIRNVIREFKNKVLTEMFPGRKEAPKTLIFAKSDSHADDIIDIVREEFGEGNDFCKKITYGSSEDPKKILTEFRNDYYPRIAVTVDMIATGTDVKPIECLLFMRDVRSKNYFEQMLGRATRTLNYEELKRVSPSATERKLGYVVVDAVGVTTSHKNVSRQLERKPFISLKNLMNVVALGERDEDTLTSLANRFIKLDKLFTEEEKDKIEKITNGVKLINVASDLLDAFDEDIIMENAQKCSDEVKNLEDSEIFIKSRNKLIEKAVEPILNNEFRNFIEDIKTKHEQIIDVVNIDKVTFSGWDTDEKEKAQLIVNIFRKFIEENKDKIDALSIIYYQKYKNRQITYKMINELYERMISGPYHINIDNIWNAYGVLYNDKVKNRVGNKLADIVSLIKFELKQINELDTFSSYINKKFQKWILMKNNGNFTEEQAEWLIMIRDHIATSLSIKKEDLELTPFNNKGGLGRYYELFGEAYEILLIEINYELIA